MDDRNVTGSDLAKMRELGDKILDLCKEYSPDIAMTTVASILCVFGKVDNTPVEQFMASCFRAYTGNYAQAIVVPIKGDEGS